MLQSIDKVVIKLDINDTLHWSKSQSSLLYACI